MTDVIAIRIEGDFLKKIENLGEEDEDRSTIIRKLIRNGYKEMLKEKAAKAYKEGKITISKAAQMAELTIYDMEQYLVEKGFVSGYSIEDLEREMALL